MSSLQPLTTDQQSKNIFPTKLTRNDCLSCKHGTTRFISFTQILFSHPNERKNARHCLPPASGSLWGQIWDQRRKKNMTQHSTYIENPRYIHLQISFVVSVDLFSPKAAAAATSPSMVPTATYRMCVFPKGKKLTEEPAKITASNTKPENSTMLTR